jgi:hypothetical protein
MLIGCALIGTTGAYGYRHFAKPASGAKVAPVIVADNAPSKIVPASTEQKSSRSQDRLPGGSERLVSREEQPVVLQPPASQAPARTELANAAAAAAVPPAAAFPPPAPPAPVQASAQPPAAGAPSTGPNAPKRIRTVTIRPEGGDKSARPVAPSHQGGSRSGPQTTATVPQSSRTAPSGSREAPLSLDPSTQTSEPAPPQQRSVAPPRRQASAPEAWSPAPRESRNGGPKLASAPSNGESGGYLVQVSSQRSESDARASYRGLQAKYSQLKSHQAIIRRADLGSKGTYYRAMVGPFGSAHDADQFCSGLKRSGGQCIILRN